MQFSGKTMEATKKGGKHGFSSLPTITTVPTIPNNDNNTFILNHIKNSYIEDRGVEQYNSESLELAKNFVRKKLKVLHGLKVLVFFDEHKQIIKTPLLYFHKQKLFVSLNGENNDIQCHITHDQIYEKSHGYMYLKVNNYVVVLSNELLKNIFASQNDRFDKQENNNQFDKLDLLNVYDTTFFDKSIKGYYYIPNIDDRYEQYCKDMEEHLIKEIKCYVSNHVYSNLFELQINGQLIQSPRQLNDYVYEQVISLLKVGNNEIIVKLLNMENKYIVNLSQQDMTNLKINKYIYNDLICY
jgi:hypothetical protein